MTDVDPFAGEYYSTLRQLAARRRFGEKDRLGSVNLIDTEARLRAAREITSGTVISLSRTLEPGGNARGDDRPAFAMDVYSGEYGVMCFSSDHVELDCHGHHNTHLDGFNHMGLDHQWYSGWALDEAQGPSIADFAVQGLVTRGVLADIPAVRGTEWVSPDEPVTDEDLDLAMKAAGVTFTAGDALLLYMGRDRYEAAGKPYYVGDPITEKRPGVGRRGAEWIAAHDVSLLAWDFMDANLPGVEPSVCVHMLLWAIGLVLVDNCDFSAAVAALRSSKRATGAFVVAPLRIEGATGCNVNPLLVI
jgi:kynurenine formamidase